MGKVKSHRASCKRFSVTGSGKVKMNHSEHLNKLGIKTKKRKINLRNGAYLSDAMSANVKRLICK